MATCIFCGNDETKHDAVCLLKPAQPVSGLMRDVVKALAGYDKALKRVRTAGALFTVEAHDLPCYDGR